MTSLHDIRSQAVASRAVAASRLGPALSRTLHRCAAPLSITLTTQLFLRAVLFVGAGLLLMLDVAFAGPFGGSDQTLGNGLRAFMQYYRGLTVLAGVGALFTAGIMKWFGRPFAGPMIASALCFAATAIGEVLYSFGRNGSSVPFSAGQDYSE